MNRELIAYELLSKGSNNRELLPSHLSIYMALLFKYNYPIGVNFKVSKFDVMKAARIKSQVTYFNCMKDLHNLGLISWTPAKSPTQDSLVTILTHTKNDTHLQVSAVLNDQVNPQKAELLTSKIEQVPSAETRYIHTNSSNNNFLNSNSMYPNTESNFDQLDFSAIKNTHAVFSVLPPKSEWVVAFFLAHKQTQAEAERFFNYNQGKNWMLSKNTPIQNWGAMARNWISKGYYPNKTNLKSKTSYVHVNNNSTKNYAEPL
ncbi:MAG: hypothetical protein MH132_06755 [Hydrotalea sp.]|nr:hypothetical protein [Hydrotalea sp.]